MLIILIIFFNYLIQYGLYLQIIVAIALNVVIDYAVLLNQRFSQSSIAIG